MTLISVEVARNTCSNHSPGELLLNIFGRGDAALKLRLLSVSDPRICCFSYNNSRPEPQNVSPFQTKIANFYTLFQATRQNKIVSDQNDYKLHLYLCADRLETSAFPLDISLHASTVGRKSGI